MSDLIDRQVARYAKVPYDEELSEYERGWNDACDAIADNAPSAQPEIVRCKECKYAPKCYGDVLMRSIGGGYIYCPVDYCSRGERRQ